MKRIHRISKMVLLTGFAFLVMGCESSIQGVKEVSDKTLGLSYNQYSLIGPYTDYRNYDLSDRDLRESYNELLQVTFNEKTQWPAEGYLPQDYDPTSVLNLGKNPGLSIRTLHKRGITGRGIGIGIIDSPLLLEHQEYADRIMLYETVHIEQDRGPEMHGSAVASIAIGRNVGVAPEADLYYIASRTGDIDSSGDWDWNFDYYAQALKRLMEVNQELLDDRKIRVISMQIGFISEMADITEIRYWIEEAKKEGIFIICSSIEDIYGIKFHGLGRDPTQDPDDPESYGPGLFWQEEFYSGGGSSERLLVPMDSRTVADPRGIDVYVFYNEGGVELGDAIYRRSICACYASGSQHYP